ncbi:uncharacterized protein LOC124326496 isoform X2 [Daphnia pulicaria]|uniref:uncharacterized protein LOC124326496 isoform X2 n=1 Tax=Daphnia pulicaria TaxID=35523 RepID=UPI001EECEAE2|nr:uncharacterized protein LOC124326496 isoform X2 [Daphnia pulicaria]
MAARNARLTRSQWTITNQLTMPLITVADTGKKSVHGLVAVAIPLTILLDTLFVDKVVTDNAGRSMQRDQYQIFKSIEDALQIAGVDGKACLLHTICEIQRNQLAKNTLAGEIVTLLLTPKSGDEGFIGFFHDYLIAKKVGRSLNQSCVDSFPRCPISLIDFFSSYSTSEVDHIATEDSFVNLKNPHLEMSKKMEHSSHSSI